MKLTISFNPKYEVGFIYKDYHTGQTTEVLGYVAEYSTYNNQTAARYVTKTIGDTYQQVINYSGTPESRITRSVLTAGKRG